MVTIEHCGRTVAADVVAFDVVWSGELPEGSPVVIAAVVTSDDGEEAVELCHERASGPREAEAQYVVDQVTGRRRDVHPDATYGDREVTVRFSAEVVGVAVDWPIWQAVVRVGGEEIARKAIPVTA